MVGATVEPPAFAVGDKVLLASEEVGVGVAVTVFTRGVGVFVPLAATELVGNGVGVLHGHHPPAGSAISHIFC